ncbi:uncharacterized protein LTR77_003801 [Saxophila tyrrhenica]|uniref:FAD/NAD(P)-binding domain-containing protein n=1 Tax=Saxophila tyrrhenica TaxID=1690608 RepID=A0AAV9PEN7_9PEZI|nr:hypothetical protein LTR77_003801 [Saxophila tyrrhenica]
MELDYDVIVVGGGFGGVYQLYNLRKLGFSVRLFEAGAKLGGIWYWNCYPGARVDTEVPVYQLPEAELFEDFKWQQKYVRATPRHVNVKLTASIRYPGRDALREYFEHMDKVWGLSKDISYNSRVTACEWDNDKLRWNVKIAQMQLNGPTEIERHSKSIIVCTGFASRPYFPPYNGIEKYKGMMYHTSAWPQENISMKDKRVAVIGTGASGVQVIQTIATEVKQLTVYQRTPNYALPMGNNELPAERLKYYKENYPELMGKMNTTFAGFLYDFNPGECMKATPEEREALFEELYTKGGLHFWLGTYADVLKNKEANAMAYEFWKKKTHARIKDKKKAEILAPEVPPHPYGTKRVSLEQNYFEAFNDEKVDVVPVKDNPISNFTSDGIITADGEERKFDLVVLATGFDAITGGVTQINIRGEDGMPIKERWSEGTRTYLGMASRNYPNMFIIYGPQAPTAFVTGGLNAKMQGHWVGNCLAYMRDKGISKIQPTADAEETWRSHCEEVGKMGLFSETESWYFGNNIPGKPKEALNYMGGNQAYKSWLRDSEENDYKGFEYQ